MSDTLRILVADDHLVVREGLRLILETEPDFVVVGEAADGEDAVRRTAEVRPDVVLMDLRMPGMSGIEAIRRIRAGDDPPAIVIVTTYDEDGLIVEGLRAGARAYLLKDADRETIFDAIRGAARGELRVRPDMLERVLAHVETPRAGHGIPPELTDRERDVLVHVVRGERNKTIARRLGIAERTVKTHLSSIYAKLGVSTRAGATAAALRGGLLGANPGTGPDE